MENFRESRLYKVFNGGVGLAAIFFAFVFFVIVIFYYILRIRQSRKNLFGELYSYLTGDAQSPVAKFLRSTIFLLLAAGFVAVIYYNVHKMLTDDPMVSVKVEINKFSPSILFCSFDITPIQILNTGYYDSLENFDNGQPTADLANSFNNIIMGKGEKQTNCMLFNDTLFAKPKENIGGVYTFELSSNTNLAFIGDFNDINMSNSFPQGELDGGKIHRSYQFSLIGSSDPTVIAETNSIVVIAPTGVVTDTEEPPLDLAVFFGNIGGYLTICGIFGFLFGSGKVSPFGFVTEYCFQYKDLDNKSDEINNDLERGNDDKDGELKAKFEALLKKYYVDMEHFDPKN